MFVKKKEVSLLEKDAEDVDLKTLPQHVALIMDGNGRWAAEKNLPRLLGHKKGAEALENAVRAAVSHRIPYLTVYAFSSENWQRPEDEISGLLVLLRRFLKKYPKQLKKESVRLSIIGDRSRFPEEIQKLFTKAEKVTEQGEKLLFTVALSYGGRWDLVQACQALAQKVQAGTLKPEEINEKALESHLQTAGLPDPDLLIRTSGEQRISNFLLWQLAYSELCFLDLFWPDFTEQSFKEALDCYEHRIRRFGKI